jgi:ribosomal protein S3AE
MNITVKNWCLTMSDSKRTYYIAIPPTKGNRIDIITDVELQKGYNYKCDPIVIEIREGRVVNVIQSTTERQINKIIHEEIRLI